MQSKATTPEQYDPYENAIAERINGILKQEFDIDKYDTDLKTKTDLVKIQSKPIINLSHTYLIRC